MQIENRLFNPAEHEQYMYLGVHQPYANDLVKKAYEDMDGNTYGVKSIEIRAGRTKHRGDILICSTPNPYIPFTECGATLGLVELYDVKPVGELTETEWNCTRVPREDRKKIKSGYAWLFRNPRMVVELPVRCSKGLHRITFDKDDIQEYPRKIVIDKHDWREIRKQIK